MSNVTINITNEKAVALEQEMRALLHEPLDQIWKYRFNKNIIKIKRITEPYVKTRQEAFDELAEPDATLNQMIIKNIIDEKDDKGVPTGRAIENPDKTKWKNEIVNGLDKEPLEIELIPVPLSLLKELTKSANHYELIFEYLIEDDMKS
jgi:hypothetical protein